MMEKEKALEIALSKIEKDFGKGAIMKLGDAAANIRTANAVRAGFFIVPSSWLRCHTQRHADRFTRGDPAGAEWRNDCEPFSETPA